MTRVPASNVTPQECPSCGVTFTPYRTTQRACSRKCRDALGPVPEADRPYEITFRCRLCGESGTARTSTPGGRREFCDACRPRADQERAERKNATRRLATTKDPAQRRQQNRRQAVARYGLTLAEHDEMLARQEGCCAICGRKPKPEGHGAASRLHIDHDHVTGKVRALLCDTCNRGIGYLRDDPAIVRRAAEYIERHRP